MNDPEATRAKPETARRPKQWRRALRAVRKLTADPSQTEQVFEILDALSGPSFERSYQRFAATPQTLRLRAEKPILIDRLQDRPGLASLPPGSLGHAYLGFMTRGHLTAEGLAEAERIAEQNAPLARPVVDAEREWFGNRMRDSHDLWHVLTGYGRDEGGEAGLLAFTFAQVPNPGIALIVLTAALVGPWRERLRWPRYLAAAWRRGRATPDLARAPWEELLPLPLDEVRARLGVPAVARAHPAGLAVAIDDSRGRRIEYQLAAALPAAA